MARSSTAKGEGAGLGWKLDVAGVAVCIFPVGMIIWGVFKYTPSEGQPWPNHCQLQTHSDCLFSLQLALKLCPE